MKTHSILHFPVVCIALISAVTVLAEDGPELVPLQLHYNAATGDNFTFATRVAESDARENHYQRVRTQGYVFTSAQPGTAPLKLFWNAHRRDYLLVATPHGENDAKGAGYEFVRVEGHVFRDAEPGTMPLRLSWRGADNFTYATRADEQLAAREEFHFVRVEGHVVQNRREFLLDKPIDYVPLLARDRGIEDNWILLKDGDRLVTPVGFRPPVDVTLVAKTDSTNLRIGYAADQVIFNWEADPHLLRVDGGPANGRHVQEAGLIPTQTFVTIKWIVTREEQAIYVDDRLRFHHAGDYSSVLQPVSVFPAVHSRVTVKSLTVKRLSDDFVPDLD